MRLIITGKNLEISDWLRDYIQKKTRKFSKYLGEESEMRVELVAEKVKNSKQRQVVQVTCVNNGSLIRSQERSADITAAIDHVVDKLDRQIKRFKDKRVTRKRRGISESQASKLRGEEPPSAYAIQRTKRFRTSPMSPEEAAEQMEKLGHTFFGFFNGETGELNIVYKREDGGYGRLEYERG
jgi:putative sigma-54 modulation protein